MSLTIVSFFTPTWEYRDHADRLIEECERLDLPRRIYEFPDTGNYLANTRWKPSAILRALGDTRGPVLWLDVDSSILRSPDAIDFSLDFMAVRNTHKPDRRWHVATMFFNRTAAALGLLALWQRSLSDWSDDEAFGRVWKNEPNWGGKAGELPRTYLEIESSSRSWRPSPEAVVVARLSKGAQKAAFQNSGQERA